MRFSWTGRRLVASGAALLSILALGGAMAGWKANSASALSPRAVVATSDVVPEPPTAPVTPPPPEVHGKTSDPAVRCANARQWVAAHGLFLPAGWGFRCPGWAVLGGSPRWGLACWNCEGDGSWIAVDIGRIGASDATLRHVIAHEICHAIEFTTLGLSTEPTADLCAAQHGAPRP